jgi:hypothetical protein
MSKTVKTKKMTPTVSYSTIAYVYYCGDKMIDAIQKCGLPIEMTGDGICLVDFTMLEETIEGNSSTVKEDKTLSFLNNILGQIQQKCTFNIESEPSEIMFIA